MENSSFFAFAFRMKYINRWSLMKNSRTENLTEHCAETAMIAHALAVIGNKLFGKKHDTERIALYALYHDLSETVTGDLPTPVKYYSGELLSSYREFEDHAKTRLLEKLPPELRDEFSDIVRENCTEEEKTLIKAADKLSALVKCIEEVKNGNSEFSKAHKSTFDALEKYDLPEVKYFIDKMIPAFYLTLDEL
ncbi:MAG: 5'-deoxynucleotidase [Clostridia bacterium]|nr:5'-deoxynucleotidase [Clostridia bacterium]